MIVYVKLTNNTDPDKYYYTGYWYWIHFSFTFFFLIPDFDWAKNVIIFGVDNSFSAHADNRKNIYLSSW